MDCDKEELEATLNIAKKSADKLFSELGYKKETYNPDVIYFTNMYIDTIYYAFNKNTKKFCFIENNEAGDISMEELRAVNLKCKELGWIE